MARHLELKLYARVRVYVQLYIHAYMKHNVARVDFEAFSMRHIGARHQKSVICLQLIGEVGHVGH